MEEEIIYKYILQYTLIPNDISESISRGTITIEEDGESNEDGATEYGKINKQYYIFPSKQWTQGLLTMWPDDNNTEVRTEPINNNKDETIGSSYSAVNKVTLYFKEVPTDLSFQNMELLDTIELMGRIEEGNEKPIPCMGYEKTKDGEFIDRTDTSDMFNNCVNLTSIIPELDMTNVERCEYMFANCQNLYHLHISGKNYNLININNIKIKKVEIENSEHSLAPWGRFRNERIYEYKIDFSMVYMFSNCYSLSDHDIVIVDFIDNLKQELVEVCKKLACINYFDMGIDVSSNENFNPSTYNFDEFIESLDEEDKQYLEEVAEEEARYCYMFAFDGAYNITNDYYREILYPWREISIKEMYIRPFTEFKVGVPKIMKVMFNPCVYINDDKKPDNPDAEFKWYLDKVNKDCLNANNYDDIEIEDVDERGIYKKITVKKPIVKNGKQTYHTLIVGQKNMPTYIQTKGLITSDYETLSVKIMAPRDKNENGQLYVKKGKVKVIDELYETYGPRGQFSYIVKPLNKVNEVSVLWSSSNESVCKIDSEGRIYPISAGKCKIRCTIKGDRTKYDEFELTVIKPIERIFFGRKLYDIDLDIAKTGFLRPPIYTYPEGAIDDTIFEYLLYNVDTPDKKITVEVDENGMMTIPDKGEYILECRAVNNKLITPIKTNINVTRKVKSIDFDINGVKDNILTIVKGKTKVLFYKVDPEDADNIAATYYIDNTDIVDIDREVNRLTAKEIGSTYLHVILDSDKSIYRKIKVEVIQPITSVVINHVEPVHIGTELQLKYTMEPSNTTWDVFDWSSSDSSILKVDQNGKVTAMGLGTADITMTSIYDESISYTAPITVSGYEIQFTVAENNSNILFKDSAPCTMEGALFEIITKDNNVITSRLVDIRIPMSDIIHVKCSYPRNEKYSLSFKGLNTIDEITKCDLKILDGNELFRGCTNLTKVCPLEGRITNANGMFDGCNNLKEIPEFDSSSILYADYMFRDCTKLEISTFKIPKVTSCTQMYKGCTNIKHIDCIGGPNVGKMDYVVAGCYALETVDVVKMGHANGTGMFKGLTNLKYVGHISLFGFVGCGSMFNGCTSLEKLPGIDTHVFTMIDCTRMFAGCISMEGNARADVFWETNCKLYTDCFKDCNKLTNYYTEIPPDWGGSARAQRIELDSYSRMFLKIGDNFKITASHYPDYSLRDIYEWSIDDESVAKLYPNDDHVYVVITDSGETKIRCRNGELEEIFEIGVYNVDKVVFTKEQWGLKVKDVYSRKRYSFIVAYDRNDRKINLDLRVEDVLKENELILDMPVSSLSKILVYYVGE